MEKKKTFELPEAIMIAFDNQDIIMASGPDSGEDPDQQWGQQ